MLKRLGKVSKKTKGKVYGVPEPMYLLMGYY
jgi:hypothetical protein